ncbi:F0F1 ATP synthase subunit A [Allofournierella sp.]|uniref:F0F1 ATP synthase subunit A n=1 Tax=Allofournierella sp. TaxID=1940256 RepID=UPI003AB341B3
MDVSINGAQIYFTIPVFGGIPITSSMVNGWAVVLIITGLCIWLTRGLKVEGVSKRQAVAELLVNTCQNFVNGNMGEKYAHFAPFIGAMFSLSALCSLSSLVGAFPATSSLSTELSWAILVFCMITFTKIRTNGFGGYLKGFTTPIWVFTPFNIISELATPISMAFRHFGNIVSGGVISTLVYAALAVLNHAVFGLLPGVLGQVLGEIPLFQVGIPAILSVYFDLFSSLMQAFIFCMLTMLYIANAAQTDEE